MFAFILTPSTEADSDFYLEVFIHSVDLKQIERSGNQQTQQRWVYLGSTGNCYSESPALVSHVQIPSWEGQEQIFFKGEREVGRVRVNKESMAFLC